MRAFNTAEGGVLLGRRCAETTIPIKAGKNTMNMPLITPKAGRVLTKQSKKYKSVWPRNE
eukprot:9073586-Karenia_brevis.AAC.1